MQLLLIDVDDEYLMIKMRWCLQEATEKGRRSMVERVQHHHVGGCCFEMVVDVRVE